MLKVRHIKLKLEEILAKCEMNLISSENSVDVRKAITSGYFYHAVKQNRNGTYRPIKSNTDIHIHPNSALYEMSPKWMIYHELIFTTREYMNQCIEIDKNWLLEIAPHYYKRSDIEDSQNNNSKHVIRAL